MLDDKEKQRLTQILDLALKAGGVQALNNVNYFVNKFGLAQPEEKKEEIKK